MHKELQIIGKYVIYYNYKDNFTYKFYELISSFYSYLTEFGNYYVEINYIQINI